MTEKEIIKYLVKYIDALDIYVSDDYRYEMEEYFSKDLPKFEEAYSEGVKLTK